MNNKIIKEIKQNSSMVNGVLKIGKLVEIKPIYQTDYTKGCDCSEIVGYDIYKYADEELMQNEDYDFDSDYITTVYLK